MAISDLDNELLENIGTLSVGCRYAFGPVLLTRIPVSDQSEPIIRR